jgi:membrane-bound ClpP family serine protease
VVPGAPAGAGAADRSAHGAGIARVERAQVDADDGPVYVMRATGTIDLGVAPYVDRVVAAAEDAGAVAIVIEIDTPAAASTR